MRKLTNTLGDLKADFIACHFDITNKSSLKLSRGYSYISVGDVPARGYIEIPGITWENFIKRYRIETIDLLKMNIEGAEKELLNSMKDFTPIKRFVISCHDFRANNNEGEYYRTRDIVEKILICNKYTLKQFSYGQAWSDDWIYAEKL